MADVSGVLDLTTVTPMVQMVESDKTCTYTRKSYFVLKTEGGYITRIIPFISGESLRGLARRRLAQPVMKKIMENSSKNFRPEAIHMFIDGGMTSLSKNLSYNEEKEWRERMPFFSIFGVGLSMSGKLIIQDAFPIIQNKEGDMVYAHLTSYTDDIGKQISGMFNRFAFSKKDDILNHENYIFDFLTVEDVIKWEKEAQEKSEGRKKKREEEEKAKEENKGKQPKPKKKKDEDNILKGTTQTWQEIEYITPGTTIRTEIGTFEDEPLTDAEKGGIALALIELVKMRRLGGYQRKNWGLYNANLNLNISGNKVGATRKINESYLLKDSTLNIDDDEVEEHIDSFWEAISKLTVDDIEELMIKMKKEK